jgi:mono/diheme cytochrome c family protein
MRALALVLVTAACGPRSDVTVAAPRTSLPRLWDDAALATWGTPVAGLGLPPSYMKAADYYAAPVDNLRTYPVYHPRYEPAGYREALVARGPQPLIEPDKLTTRAAWIDAGRRVFEELDTPVSRTADPAVIAHFTDAAAIDRYRDATHDAITADGILPDYRWIVGQDGVLRLGLASCAGCHTRIMPDGSLLDGGPSNHDLSEIPETQRMLDPSKVLPHAPEGQRFYAQFGVPWLADDPQAPFKTKTDADVHAFWALDTGAPTGTMFARVNGSPLHSTRMADLRGIKDRHYLDTTATHLNRGPEDLARYGILVEYADIATFGPYAMLPQSRPDVRPPDEAMYAMALYLYSLEPAPSPFPFDATAARGKQVFDDLDCAECHTPPTYTSNELVAVDGFTPPAGSRLPVAKKRVGTDPAAALRTRKGTGYYRIPSLRGVWYRGLFEHEGSIATLEDWFDPRRLRDDYVPSGTRGPGVAHRAVPGHEFGLDLDPDDKRALIAFLRTL